MPRKVTHNNEKMKRKETPMIVWLWMLGVGILSYLVARVALYTSPHPFHWASGASGLVVGYIWPGGSGIGGEGT